MKLSLKQRRGWVCVCVWGGGGVEGGGGKALFSLLEETHSSAFFSSQHSVGCWMAPVELIK